jgi:hypothetical protein
VCHIVVFSASTIATAERGSFAERFPGLKVFSNLRSLDQFWLRLLDSRRLRTLRLRSTPAALSARFAFLTVSLVMPSVSWISVAVALPVDGLYRVAGSHHFSLRSNATTSAAFLHIYGKGTFWSSPCHNELLTAAKYGVRSSDDETPATA